MAVLECIHDDVAVGVAFTLVNNVDTESIMDVVLLARAVKCSESPDVSRISAGILVVFSLIDEDADGADNDVIPVGLADEEEL